MMQEPSALSVGERPLPAAAIGSHGHGKPFRRWLVALILMALVITGYFDRISVAVLFNNKDFQTALGIGFNPALLGMLMTAFFLVYGISSFFLSYTGDRFGPRRMLIGCSVIWGALMLVMGSVGSYGAMLVSRVLLGIAEGPQFSWIMKVVSRWFPETERGRAHMIWLAGSPLGSAIGFPVIIWLVAAFGWRDAFYALAGLSILVILPLVIAFVTTGPPGASRDVANVELPESKSLWEGCGAFLKSRDFWLLTLFDCGELTYLWGLNSWLPTYLQRVRHFDIQHLGLYSSLPFIFLLVGEILSGVISDRFYKKAPLLFIGMTVAALLLYLGTVVPNGQAAAVTIAFSAGFFGLTVPATYTLAQRIIPSAVLSSGIGVLNGIANMVGALAPFAMGVVITATHNNFSAGLMVLVFGSLICSCAMLPLFGRH